MKLLLFWVVAAAVLMNCATVLWSIVRPDRRVWPPPRRNSRQFFYNGIVSYTGLIGVVVLGFVDWNSLGLAQPLRFLAGGALLACGGFALWGYLALGLHASQGLGGPLVTSGAYRYSRNPQYVGTIPAVFGFALLCGSLLSLIAALLMSAWFLLVPFAEESWCRERLGHAYEDYCKRVPRYLGLGA